MQEAIERGVPAPVIASRAVRALRFARRQPFAMRCIAALRNEFGGHAVRSMTHDAPGDQDIVIVGATGDLARRKLLPALYNLFRRRPAAGDGASSAWRAARSDDDQFREPGARGGSEGSRAPAGTTKRGRSSRSA